MPHGAQSFAEAILDVPVCDRSGRRLDPANDHGYCEFLKAVCGIDIRPPGAPETPSGAELFARAICGEPYLSEEELDAYVNAITTREGSWDPAKHPRGAFPQNRGWWSPTGDASGGGPSSGEPPTTPPPTTKSQLPADSRGAWVSGTEGNGVFRYNNSVQNQQAGLAGKEVRFEHGNIAIGGFPPESYYGGNANIAGVDIGEVTGFEADNLAADAQMRKKLGNPDWRKPKGFLWNHAGPPGSKRMELIDLGTHEPVSHKGPAAEPRAMRRASRGGGASGRAVGALTVYLAAHDALQTLGVLQPSYQVGDSAVYHFAADDGSIFVVHEGGWFSSPKIEFVAGPRKGQTEKLSSTEVEQYRNRAEQEFGKYIPGSLISQLRFIPGRQRTRLPLYDENRGVRREIGWIDASGVHYHFQPIISA